MTGIGGDAYGLVSPVFCLPLRRSRAGNRRLLFALQAVEFRRIAFPLLGKHTKLVLHSF